MRGGRKLEALETTVPHHFRCPISLDLMLDPVTVSTGHTFDRTSIETWFSTGNATCPVTRVTLQTLHVIPNHTLRRLIQDWCPSSGITRIPTPKQPADSQIFTSLLSLASSESGQSGAALARLARLVAESDKNRVLAASCDAARTLIPLVFAGTRELARGSLSVLSLLSLESAECAYVAADPTRIGRLASLLLDESVEARVDAAAVVEMVVSGTRSTEVRTRIVETEGKITDLEKHDAERALAVAELLCRTESGCAAFAVHALTVPVLAKALLRVSERATEFAAGALLAVCATSEVCRREAVAAGVMTRVLLVVQSECTERAKRKAQALLKLLKDSWPEHCQMGSLDDQYYGCSAVVPF